jgi:hypothetical protein
MEIEALCLGPFNHTYLLPCQVTHNLNERILRLLKSTRPFEMAGELNVLHLRISPL